MRERVQHDLTNEEMFYAMNLEHWELEGPPDVVAASLRELKRAADLIHTYNPNLLIGYYRLMPRRALGATYAGPDSEMYQRWQEENDRLSNILEASVDIIFPSLYVLHLGDGTETTEERWSIYARENINEARRISRGKPVVTFLNLYYQPNGVTDDGLRPRNPKAWQWIEPEFLIYQLATLNVLADGAVLYDDRNQPWSQFESSGIAEAIALFHRATEKNAVDKLKSFYEQQIDIHRDELNQKLDLQIQLSDLQWQLGQANSRVDVRRASVLAHDAYLLEVELQSQIDLWPMILDFLNGIL